MTAHCLIPEARYQFLVSRLGSGEKKMESFAETVKNSPFQAMIKQDDDNREKQVEELKKKELTKRIPKRKHKAKKTIKKKNKPQKRTKKPWFRIN